MVKLQQLIVIIIAIEQLVVITLRCRFKHGGVGNLVGEVITVTKVRFVIGVVLNFAS